MFSDGERATDPKRFFDQERVEYCSAARFSDGERYCMPTSAAGEVYFTDQRCTKPIGVRQSWEADPPSYFIGYYKLHGESLPSRLYRSDVGAATPSELWALEDGICVNTTIRFGTYYSVGEIVLPTELVRLRERSRIRGSRIEVGVDASEDGLVAFGAFYDQVVGECTELADSNATDAICTESPFALATVFADAACTEPLAWDDPTSSYAPNRIVNMPDESVGCRSVFDVGAPVAVGNLYDRAIGGSGGCVPHGPSGSQFRGTSPSKDGFAHFSRLPRTTRSRVSEYVLEEGGVQVPTTDFFDHELGSECWLSWVGTDLLCLPDAQQATTVFADSTCSTTLKIALVEQADCAEHTLFAFDDDGRYPILEPYEQTMYELTTGDRCAEYFPRQGLGAYSLGPPLSFDSLARATIELQR